MAKQPCVKGLHCFSSLSHETILCSYSVSATTPGYYKALNLKLLCGKARGNLHLILCGTVPYKPKQHTQQGSRSSTQHTYSDFPYLLDEIVDPELQIGGSQENILGNCCYILVVSLHKFTQICSWPLPKTKYWAKQTLNVTKNFCPCAITLTETPNQVTFVVLAIKLQTTQISEATYSQNYPFQPSASLVLTHTRCNW